MIDYVHLKADIYIRDALFNWCKWKKGTLKDNTLIYYHRFRGVGLYYYPDKSRMTISGKILMLIEDTEVLNVDDIYELDLDQFIEDINSYLNGLFTTPLTDVRCFHVFRIDYCFNVKTPYVKQYLAFMNEAFRLTDHGQRINYVQRRRLDGSVYVKTAADYKRNERRNYVLNYYDKTDRLHYQQDRKHRIPKSDFKYANNVLRLEVQCGYQFIRQICKTFSIEPLFGYLFDYNVAFKAEKTVYRRVFHCDEKQDYYAYNAAKALLSPRNKSAKQALLTASQGHRINTVKYDYGKKQLMSSGIYPFCFLPRNGDIARLDNPIKLIHKKLQEYGLILD